MSTQPRQSGTFLGDGTAAIGDIFRIEIASNNNVVFTKNGTPICSASDCSFSNPQNYPYYLVFKASDFTGRITSVVVSSTSGGGNLETPTNLQATNGSGSEINLSWQYNSSNVSGFKIERKLGTQGTYAEIATVSASARHYSDISEKPANRPFIYRIRAFNNTTNSSYSNESSAVTPYTGNASITTNRDYLPPSIQPPPLPLAGQKFIDETFGTQIMRLTDEADGFQTAIGSSHPDYAKSFGAAYSIWGSFNYNNTRIFVVCPEGDGYFIKFDPNNFQRLGGLLKLSNTPDGQPATDGLVWSRNNPNTFYGVAGKKIYQGEIIEQNGVSSIQYTVVKDFTSNLANDLPERNPYIFKLSVSDDTDDVFWIQIRRSEPFFSGRQSMGTTIIAYKKSTNTILYQRDFCTNSTSNCVDENKGSVIDKTGRILSNLNQTYPTSGTLTVHDPQIIDLANNNSSSTVPAQSPYFSWSHVDLGRGKAVGADGNTNSIRKWDLVNVPHRSIQLLQFRDWSQDTHYSMLADNENWALVTPYIGLLGISTNDEPIKDEIFQIKTDGSGKIRRLAHHFSNVYYVEGDDCVIPNNPRQHGCYFAIPKSNISRDGRFVAFSSNWDNRHGRVDVFIAKIPLAPQTPFSDYDNDRKSDVSVFRPSNGTWYIQQSTNGFTSVGLGTSTDIIAPADFDGDGKTDVAIWRPSNGTWYIINSSNGSTTTTQFGANGDIPVQADYDGDGKADIAVWRPSDGVWYRLNSSDGSFFAAGFGQNGDRPAVGDYDGDGKYDLAIFRPSDGNWWLNRSTAGVIVLNFGISTDKIVPADYTGDGKTDVAFWRPSAGEWFILRSEDFSYFSIPFGTNGDIPAPADFDGDGITDLTVFRPSDGTWYLLQTTNGYSAQQFGLNGDTPTPSTSVR
jgi:hypothetical protein